MISAAAGALSHAIAALAFCALLLMLMLRWRDRVHVVALTLCCAVSVAWAVGAVLWPSWGELVETLRSTAWSALLLMLLAPARRRLLQFALVLTLLCAISIALPSALGVIVVRLMLAVLGMLLVEQLYRNTAPRERWGIKFACMGIGVLFAYDFFLYSDAALLRHINDDIWAARGVVNALAVPLLAVSVARNPRWNGAMGVSRSVVFHSAALIGAAIYLLLMASSGYYLRMVGGDWGRVMQLAFLFGSAILLAGVLFSGSLRARLKISISKNFYKERYDYRAEWLGFTRALSEDGPGLAERSVAAVAALVESPAGALWIVRDGGTFAPLASWNMAQPQDGVAPQEPICQFLETRQWVVDVRECVAYPERYAMLALPDWLAGLAHIWLLVPLMLHGRLFGFIALTLPRAPIHLNWEVTDLLKIAGSQAASYLAHRESSNSLMVARQFESFNRVSTFIVHDLKNLVFQLSLLLSNADKHRHNPAFQADMLGTLEHSVSKMKQLLQKLGRAPTPEQVAPLRLDALLREAAQAKALAEPAPALASQLPELTVAAHWERLARVVGHLLQNAIDASPRDGQVRLALEQRGACAVLEVSDSGCGMSTQFLRERLFKPFETTKPSGMGIGVFESREYIRELGGQLEVSSVESVGSTFRVILPLHVGQENGDEQA